jgi:hypothetical protein
VIAAALNAHAVIAAAINTHAVIAAAINTHAVIAAAINTHALVKMLYSSAAAGVGVAVVFSLAILGATRSSELRRAHRTGATAAYTALAAAGLLLSAGIVIYGLVLVAHKT